MTEKESSNPSAPSANIVSSDKRKEAPSFEADEVKLKKKKLLDVVQCAKPENQIREWNDFRKYVNVVHKGEHGSGEKTEYQCSLCGKIMSHGNIMMHIESAHFRGFLIHTCPICQKTFEAKSLLNNHKQRDHN